MTLRHASFALFFLLLILSLPLPTSASEDTALDRLILNGGESIRIDLKQTANDALIITQGKANRVPTETRPPNGGENVELDVSSRSFALRTSARQIVISGARSASIAGIDTPCWGNFERPALFVDRDCKVTLSGRAAKNAVVEVHPLAIAAIDARGLEAGEIVIIGNAGTNIRHRSGTKVSFFMRERNPETRTSGNADGWETTPDAASPSAPPQEQPPQPASPAPPPAPGQDRLPSQP